MSKQASSNEVENTSSLQPLSLPFSNTSNDEIASKISKQTIMMAARYLPLDDPVIVEGLKSYNLVITGTVGAGKSTMCESIAYILRCIHPSLPIITYPEFLYINDSELSSNLLCKKFVGGVSATTFQSYVLDNWRFVLKQNEPWKHSGFKLFERCIDDTVICFCNFENKEKRMSDLQLVSLYEDLKQLVNEFDIPTYFELQPHEKNSHFTKIYSTDLNYNLQRVLSIISADIANGITNRIIGLSVESKTSKNRIILRNRDGESGFTDEQIIDYNDHYERLFNMLDHGKRITRFVDIGALM